MRKNAFAFSLSMLLAFAVTGEAAEPRRSNGGQAAPASAETSSAPPSRFRWYGYQTLLTDAAGVAMVIGAGASENPGLAAFGLATYLVGGPMIHVANNRPGAAGGSIALRLGLPLAGGGIAFAAAQAHTCEKSGEDSGCGWQGLGQMLAVLFGGAIGAGFALLLDATVLARQPVPAAEPAPAKLGFSALPTRGGITVGASGSF